MNIKIKCKFENRHEILKPRVDWLKNNVGCWISGNSHMEYGDGWILTGQSDAETWIFTIDDEEKAVMFILVWS